MRVVLSALVVTTMLAVVGCSTTAQNPNYQQTTKYRGSNPYADKAVVQQATYQTQVPSPITYAPQQASYNAAPQQAFQECITREGKRKMIGTAAGGVVGGLVGRKIAGDNKTLGTIAGAAIGGAAGYGIADKTIRCNQVAAPIVRQSAPTYQTVPQAVTYEAPAATTQGSGIQENTESYGDGGTPGYYAVNGIELPTQSSGSQYAQIQTLSPQQIVPEPMPVPTGFTAIPTQVGSIRHRVIVGDTLYSLARTTCSSVTEIQQMNTINADFYIRVGEDIMVPSGRCVE